MQATSQNPFGYFKPSEEMLPKIQSVREAYTALYQHLLTLPHSRERAVAITELETSAMWAIKGLVHEMDFRIAYGKTRYNDRVQLRARRILDSHINKLSN
jgi:hypothetical protein